MKIIYCNCRGVGSEDFCYAFLDIVHSHNPTIFILIEIKIPSNHLDIFFGLIILMIWIALSLTVLLVESGFSGGQLKYN